MPDHRAHFDFEIRFANGGDLTGTGFRLDVPSADVDDERVSRLLVQHLGLTLVDTVELRGLRIVDEPHRGSRGVPSAETHSAGRIVDLSHPIRAGLVTYPGLPAPVITPHLTRADSRAKYAPGTEFAMDVITMVGNTGTYLDSPFHRYADGCDLAGLDLSTLVVCAQRSSISPMRGTGSGAASGWRPWPTATCAAPPCCCTPVGTSTSGHPATVSARHS
jgi:arylformamidase